MSRVYGLNSSGDIVKHIFAMGLGAFILCGVWAFPASAQPLTVQKGRTVTFDYTLHADGKVVDTNIGKKPMVFQVGDGRLIPGLVKRMKGMKIGEEKTIVVPAAEAYGPVDPEAIVEVPKSAFKNLGQPVKPGMTVRLTNPQGKLFMAVVQKVKDKTFVLNFNHPLAGKDLTFDVKVLDIK